MPQMFNPKVALMDQLSRNEEKGKFAYDLMTVDGQLVSDAPTVYSRTAEIPWGFVTLVGTERNLVLKTASAVEIDEPKSFVAPRRFKIREIYPLEKGKKLEIVCVQTGI